jgi:hypothetical protein
LNFKVISISVKMYSYTIVSRHFLLAKWYCIYLLRIMFRLVNLLLFSHNSIRGIPVYGNTTYFFYLFSYNLIHHTLINSGLTFRRIWTQQRKNIVRFMVFNATFNNILVIWWRSVLRNDIVFIYLESCFVSLIYCYSHTIQ